MKPTVDLLQRAQPPRTHGLQYHLRLWVVQIHKRFKDHDAIALGGLCNRVKVSQRCHQWLLAKYMFARGGSFYGPFPVEQIGQGIIDRIDFWVGQNRFVAAIGACNAMFLGISLCLCLIAAGNCH